MRLCGGCFGVWILLAGTSVWMGGVAGAEPICAEARGWPLAEEVSDEFAGGCLDASKWDDWCRTFPGRSAAGGFGAPCLNGFQFAPENVAVTNGELVLAARLLDASEQTHRNAYLRHAPYATAIVKSRRKIRYGYFEIRAKTMAACVSNAFWLYDPHSDDLTRKFTEGDVSEEIDVFEVTGRPDSLGRADCTRTYYNTLHLYCTPYLEGVVNRKKIKKPNMGFKTKTSFSFCDDYHVYGLLWTPERIVWYLDGRKTGECANADFRRPLHVTFDCEVFTDWFGTPDPADLPSRFRIDYVRVWSYRPFPAGG